MVECMPSALSHTLNFSGTNVFTQQQQPATQRLHEAEASANVTVTATGAEIAMTGSRPCIIVCNGFSVTSAGGTVARWQSRKARQMLKILIARRGVATSRETVMDLLWSGEPATHLANRFSVALATVRRALDPTKLAARDAYVEHRDGLLRLRIDAVSIDIEEFLDLAASALASTEPRPERHALLARAHALYTGDPLVEEPTELWAAELRREVHLAFFAVAHALAASYAHTEDYLSQLDTYRSILALDAYDQRAHEGLIDALKRLGSHGQAALAQAEFFKRMRELGLAG